MSSIVIAKSCGMSIQTAYGNVSKQPTTFLTYHISSHLLQSARTHCIVDMMAQKHVYQGLYK